jgi:5-hydroxyisourate hydrolase
VAHDRPTISTHVLDTGRGLPAAGVRVRLWRVGDGGQATMVGESVTDADGRVPDLLAGLDLEPGGYRLEFLLGEERFFGGLSVGVRIDDATRGYHIPLLLAPYGLTTYRGS